MSGQACWRPVRRLPSDTEKQCGEAAKVYRRLVQLETAVDNVLARRTLQLRDVLTLRNTRPRSLRVVVFNTYSGQSAHPLSVADARMAAHSGAGDADDPTAASAATTITTTTTAMAAPAAGEEGQVCDDEAAVAQAMMEAQPTSRGKSPASWTLRIQGCLLPEEDECHRLCEACKKAGPAKRAGTHEQRRAELRARNEEEKRQRLVMSDPQNKLSRFLRRMTVELDPLACPGARTTVEWRKAPRASAAAAASASGCQMAAMAASMDTESAEETDGFEIFRLGEREFVAKIKLDVDHVPPVYAFSKPLQELMRAIAPDAPLMHSVSESAPQPQQQYEGLDADTLLPSDEANEEEMEQEQQEEQEAELEDEEVLDEGTRVRNRSRRGGRAKKRRRRDGEEQQHEQFEFGSMQMVALSVWDYASSHNLLSAAPLPRGLVVTCDALLRRTFGCASFAWMELPQLLMAHFTQPRPVELDFPVRLSGDPVANSVSFTIPVLCSDLAPSATFLGGSCTRCGAAISTAPCIAALLPDASVRLDSVSDASAFCQAQGISPLLGPAAPRDQAIEQRACSELDDRLDALLRELHRRRDRQRVLRLLARDPSRTVVTMAKAALRDRGLAAAPDGRNPDEERHAAFYASSLYNDQALRAFLARHSNPQPVFSTQ